MVQENGTEATDIQEQQTQTPTETVETLQAKLRELETQLNKRADDVRGLNKTLQQRAGDLKSQTDLRNEIREVKDTVELLATAIATQKELGSEELEEMPKTKRQDVLAALSQKKQEQDAKRRQETLQVTMNSYKARVDDLGLTEKDDSYWQVYELVTSGDPMRLRRAEILLDKLEATKTTEGENKVKPTETEEARIERLTSERVQKILKERNLLIDETGGPSAVSASAEEARAAYVRREISETEARKRGVRF